MSRQLFNQHIRMTASEIALGRYLRAPDHPTGQQAADEFASAFDNLSKDEPAVGAADDKGGTSDGDGSGAAAVAAGGPGADAGATGGDGGAAGGEAGADDKGGAPAGDDKGGAAAPAGDDKGAGAAADDKGDAGAADDGKGGKGKAAAPAAAAPDADTVLDRLAEAVAKRGPAKKDEPAAAPAAVETPQEQPLFTADEEAKLEHFKKEWPEVAEAFELQSRALAHSVLKYAFGQIAEQFTPMRDMVEAMAARTHYGDLKDKVGEYTNEERDEIVAWVGEQPTYLQKAMTDVIEGGTAEEVADLVSRYREATGKAKPAGAGADTKEPSGGEPELSDEAKKAAAALAPVSSKRSAVQGQDDPGDFGAAFTKFADMV
jgi:hypothetical protein